MPYHIEKDGDQWCVIETANKKNMGCSPSEAEAKTHMVAIYANENKAMSETEPDNDPDDPCVAEQMKKLMADGSMSKADAMTKAQAMCPEGEAKEVKLSEKSETRLVQRVIDAVKGIVTRKEADPEIGGFQVFKDAAGQDRWMAWYSNNFEDREHEFFSEKGFDRYVQRLDLGLVPMPKLRSWHVPGSEYGQADWVDRIGHFHVATGTYDDNELGRAGKAYDEAHAREMGVSHGLLHRRDDKVVVDGKNVYKDWNTFEISPLPFKRAANDLTAFAVESETALKEAEMTEEKRKHLVEKYGEANVARMEAATEQRGKEIEEYRAYKDFIHPDEANGEAKVNKEALEAADKAFGEFMPQLMEDTGEAVTAALQSVKAVTAVQADNVAMRKELADALAEIKAIRDGAPRASQSAKTVIKEDDPLNLKSQLGKTKEQEALAEIIPGLFKNG